MYTQSGKTTLIGLTSFGQPDDKKDTIILCTNPVAYTRVSSYINWIRSHIGNDYCTT